MTSCCAGSSSVRPAKLRRAHDGLITFTRLLISALSYDASSDEPIRNNSFDPILVHRIHLAIFHDNKITGMVLFSQWSN